jgi:hypothetical protein
MFVRRGGGLREASRRFNCSASTVCFWVRRARNQRLARVDWSDRPSGSAVPANRTVRAVEQRIVRVRRWLGRHDALGYIGPEAVRRTVVAQGMASAPSARTIARILRRCGVLPQKHRRQPPPPPGWYLPAVADGRSELDQLDVVEGLHLRGAGAVEVLTGVSLWGKLALAVPILAPWRIETITTVLHHHWRQWGAPSYLQLDNDTRFAGSTRAVRRLGRFVRFCLAHGVVPVFTPPRETGFQAAVESFNGLWQQKLWQRFRHRHLGELRARNHAFLAAHRRLRVRESVPRRAGVEPAERLIFLRRTDARGRVYLLGTTITVAPAWPHRLIRCDLAIRTHRLRCYALRRRDPRHQPLLKTLRFPLLGVATF